MSDACRDNDQLDQFCSSDWTASFRDGTSRQQDNDTGLLTAVLISVVALIVVTQHGCRAGDICHSFVPLQYWMASFTPTNCETLTGQFTSNLTYAITHVGNRATTPDYSENIWPVSSL